MNTTALLAGEPSVRELIYYTVTRDDTNDGAPGPEFPTRRGTTTQIQDLAYEIRIKRVPSLRHVSLPSPHNSVNSSISL